MQRLIVFFLLVSYQAFGSVGMGDWSAITPGGNEIQKTDSNDGLVLYFKSYLYAPPVTKLVKWYFYKGNVIGETQKPISGFFVVSEDTGQTLYFNNRQSWDKFLVQHALKPLYRTRWYNDNWQLFGDEFKFVAFLLFPLTIGFVVWIIILIRNAYLEFMNDSDSRLSRYTLGFVSVCFFLLYLYDKNPQSF